MDKKCYGIAKCDAVQIINVDFSAVIIDTFVTRFLSWLWSRFVTECFLISGVTGWVSEKSQ